MEQAAKRRRNGPGPGVPAEEGGLKAQGDRHRLPQAIGQKQSEHRTSQANHQVPDLQTRIRELVAEPERRDRQQWKGTDLIPTLYTPTDRRTGAENLLMTSTRLARIPQGEAAMANIVYVLTNPAMPGLVKIGMTDRDDVQRRMSDLYTTGVPLPFECVAARAIEDREALEIEKALHTAFGPNRVNSSREFFEIDPEQVQVLLRVMPGKDVTPRTGGQEPGIQEEDQAAATEYKRRRTRTNELEFLESLNEHGRTIYRRVLALEDPGRVEVKYATKGFSLNVVCNGTLVPVCSGFPPSYSDQRLYTEFNSMVQKSSVPQDVADALKQEALDTGLFSPARTGVYLFCRTHLPLEESQLNSLITWLQAVIAKIREFETPGINDS